MITEDYCSPGLAQALQAKAKELFKYYHLADDEKIGLYKTITHQRVMKWLREVHHICITIYPDKMKGYEAVLYDTKDNVEIILQSFGVYGSRIFRDSYEEAVEVALKYCLENLI